MHRRNHNRALWNEISLLERVIFWDAYFIPFKSHYLLLKGSFRSKFRYRLYFCTQRKGLAGSQGNVKIQIIIKGLIVDCQLGIRGLEKAAGLFYLQISINGNLCCIIYATYKPKRFFLLVQCRSK